MPKRTLSGAALASSQSKKARKGKKAVVAGSEDEGTMNNELTPRSEYHMIDEMLRVRKDTRVKTKRRAPIPEGAEPMPEMCLRCAGDLESFPDLQCIASPTSTANKCTDCIRKSKSCTKVPAELLEVLEDLKNAAFEVRNKTGSVKVLKRNMHIFETETARYVRQKKERDEMLARTPWVPVVEAVTALNAGVCMTIGQLVERVDQIASSVADIEALFKVRFAMPEPETNDSEYGDVRETAEESGAVEGEVEGEVEQEAANEAAE